MLGDTALSARNVRPFVSVSGSGHAWRGCSLRRMTVARSSGRRELTLMERLKMVRWAAEDRQRAIGKRLG